MPTRVARHDPSVVLFNPVVSRPYTDRRVWSAHKGLGRSACGVASPDPIEFRSPS